MSTSKHDAEIGASGGGTTAPEHGRPIAIANSRQHRECGLDLNQRGHAAVAFHTVAGMAAAINAQDHRSRVTTATTTHLRLTLIEPDETAGAGFLVIDEESFSTTVRLRRHELEILKLLNDALAEDRDLPPDVRGWRRIGYIAEAMGRDTGYPCAKETISRYLCNIRAAIRKETGSPDIAWLQQERSCGQRLTVPMATTVLSQ